MARQNFVGLVISQGKMQKTVKVRVSGRVYDRKIDKEIIKRKDYLVHDEGEICKEGDIVRIESIPKRSSKKAFAVAEIKVNKGQQFALYQDMAKERVSQEIADRLNTAQNAQAEGVLSKIADLRKLDSLTEQVVNASSEEIDGLVNEIESIKQKYNISQWPTTDELIELEVNHEAKAADGTRVNNIKYILDELLSQAKYEEFVKDVVNEKAKKPFEEVASSTKKNILRKYVLNLENPCPVPIPHSV
ncbi:uncharacterized protein SPAPADRAFT_62557 [Spathaspora passalidarum NRRL Y-27907]|uniref:Uncharacterized protein n=1 Tax=Spathaspora passalidarum (strain NRRL Y-27907 / 11-Y1) TaxID=619300 RepID=G3ASK3_SPAPN|nr:uncharacterized protein SPAPADRAFT_62557 [Spathaspora passalidarum NRRL Y-27907]EGW30689.1 hypothetical protein SPAPADRAFT_62557 [Spathaspora passalidarum NRRL Y-27907]